MGHDKLTILAVSLLGAMGLVAYLAIRIRLAAVVLILLAFAWFIADQYFEGPILWRFNYRHGLVVSDFVGIAALLIGVFLLVRPPSKGRAE